MIFNSMMGMRYDLPALIDVRFRRLGLSGEEVRHALGLIHWLDDVYGLLDMRIAGYHNHVHNMAVSYTGLLLLDPDVRAWKPRDVKIVYLAGLTSDVHLRDPHKGKDEDRTPASMEETLRQLRELLGLSGAGGAPREARYVQVVTGERKAFFQGAFRGLLGVEDFASAYAEIEALIRRTDFPSDVPFLPDAYRPLTERARYLARDWTDAGAARPELDVLLAEIEGDEKVLTATRRYLEIERTYIASLERVAEDRRAEVNVLGQLLETADQSAYYVLGSPAMVVNEVIPELQKEIRAVSVERTYPGYFVPQLLNDAVLATLARLPAEHKDNFVAVLGECARLSGHREDWTVREPSVRRAFDLSSLQAGDGR